MCLLCFRYEEELVLWPPLGDWGQYSQRGSICYWPPETRTSPLYSNHQFPFQIQFSIRAQHYHVSIFPSLSSMIGFYPIVCMHKVGWSHWFCLGNELSYSIAKPTATWGYIEINVPFSHSAKISSIMCTPYSAMCTCPNVNFPLYCYLTSCYHKTLFKANW